MVKLKYKFEYKKDPKGLADAMGFSEDEEKKLLDALQELLRKVYDEHVVAKTKIHPDSFFTQIIERILNSENLNETQKMYLVFRMGGFYEHTRRVDEMRAMAGMLMGGRTIGMGMGMGMGGPVMIQAIGGAPDKETIEAHKKEIGCDGDCAHCNREEKEREYMMKKMKEMKEQSEKKTDGMYS